MMTSPNAMPTKDRMPRASVIVTVYNGEKFLEETLQSARNQSLENIEIICIDDASSDGSAAILARHAAQDDRIRIITLQTNSGGPAKPKNKGIELARGEYISFLDKDDIDHPDKLLWATTILDARPDRDAVFFDVYTLFEDGQRSTTGTLQKNDFLTEARELLTPIEADLYDCSRDWIRQMAGGTMGISTQSLVIRKSSFLRAVGQFDERLKIMDDADAWFKIAYHCRLLFCTQPACWYRLTGNSISSNLLKMRKEAIPFHEHWHGRIHEKLSPAESARYGKFIADIYTYVEWQSRLNGAPSLQYALGALRWGTVRGHLPVLLKSVFASAGRLVRKQKKAR